MEDHVIYRGKSHPVVSAYGSCTLSLKMAGMESISELEGLDQCQNIDTLLLGDNRIKDITGLECLPNLIDLDLQENEITEIKGLENLTKLKRLNLSKNNITEIKGIQHLSDLWSLDLSNNQINKIQNINNCTKLEQLYLSANQIEKIEGLENLNDLKELELDLNKIKRIENIDQLRNLSVLSLGGNEINKIEKLNHLTNLKKLYLSGNYITKIENLDSLSNLRILGLVDLPIEKIEGLDGLILLEGLYINSNAKEYLDIEGFSHLCTLVELMTYNFKLHMENDIWHEDSINLFRFISMIKESDYQDIRDWKQVFKDAPLDFYGIRTSNSKYQLEWLYQQCTPKIIDLVEKILKDPEFEEVRKGKERNWKELLEEARNTLFQLPKEPINWEEKRESASVANGDRIFCVYVKRPDCQMKYIKMAYIIADIMKENIILDENPYYMDASEEKKLQDFKYYPNLASIHDFYIRLTPTDEFKKFFKNEMQHEGRLKLKIKLFGVNKELFDGSDTPLGTNFLILKVPFKAAMWQDYPFKDMIQDGKNYCGFYRTKSCQIFEKKYENFLRTLKNSLGEEIGTGFYIK
ncbi:MAG: leucine-rich repeat domain-containing protein [Candidatus Lokiarchaeota archaeon]|nr:leucine-rich repeat domain-containing protein [Candidatus Lokiarchaeota archaeon]